MNIVFNLEGVLSSESGEPIRSGAVLYYALNNSNRVAIITSQSKDEAERWLLMHGIIGYDDLIDNSLYLEGDDLKKRQFKMNRTKVPVELYVDADPSMCAWVFEEQRIPTILFTHPSYAKVEHRPDAPKPYRSWTEIEEAVNRVNISRATQRIAPPEDLGEYSD